MIDLSNLDKLKKQIEYGKTILNKFFELSDKELKEKLLSVIQEEYSKELIDDEHPKITRLIVNEEPDEIEFLGYNRIKIDWSGISYKEHHGFYKRIIEFNEHFKF